MPCCQNDDVTLDFDTEYRLVFIEDPRKTALKNGLRQLRPHELWRLVEWVESGGAVLLDRDENGWANYNGQAYCPLAIAVSLHEGIPWASDNDVYQYLTGWQGFKVYNTRGVRGEFYTTNRRADLLVAAHEVIAEKELAR